MKNMYHCTHHRRPDQRDSSSLEKIYKINTSYSTSTITIPNIFYIKNPYKNDNLNQLAK